MHGSSVMPRLISAAGRCMFATSAEPEKPIGPVPPRAAQNDVEEEHPEHLPEIKELSIQSKSPSGNFGFKTRRYDVIEI
jgi:hypothetical protein